MADLFENFRSGLESSARRSFEISPNDNEDVDIIPRAIRVGGGGVIVALLIDDAEGQSPVAYENVADGDVMDIRPRRIFSTGTTATNIVGWT